MTTKKSEIISADYETTLKTIIKRINKARLSMLKKVNKETVLLYWFIGNTVSDKIKTESWGDSTVERLSKDLQNNFPGVRGFSSRNIWYMKKFYESYYENSLLQPLVAEIGWVQNCIILEKCKDEKEKEFYIRSVTKTGWSKNDLKEKISEHYYQNKLLVQNNFSDTVPSDLRARTAWEFIDDYAIEIINPDQPIAEKELENSIVKNIVDFLSDMGGSFAFVGRQFRIEYREKEYFIDLLFFNLDLNCYVAVELKAREFDPKDLGQLQMYLLAVNETIRKKDQNQTIGILICRDKDRMVVEYLLGSQKQPIGVSTYNKFRKLKQIPKEIAKYLPSEEEIIKRLGYIPNKSEIKNNLDR
jgi:predicted nuclease of restriction endonuclease-like (RecB) superfamily